MLHVFLSTCNYYFSILLHAHLNTYSRQKNLCPPKLVFTNTAYTSAQLWFQWTFKHGKFYSYRLFCNCSSARSVHMYINTHATHRSDKSLVCANLNRHTSLVNAQLLKDLILLVHLRCSQHASLFLLLFLSLCTYINICIEGKKRKTCTCSHPGGLCFLKDLVWLTFYYGA